MKKNGLQIITRRMVIFNTPCCIWQLVAQVGISRSNSLSNNFANKNEYGKKHIQGSVLRERQQGENGIVPIMGRVTINGTVAQFSCKQNIPKTLWDVKGNKAKGKSREARDINLALDNIKAQIIKHYQRISDREAFVTAEMVRNAYQESAASMRRC